ncbi:MAG TPA: trypsin-like peptidase domain-containing protein [Propionibacterium sp.]|nr:trypsin-like peptidase domain-containing protein [Propionibacterium sp.]
MHNPTRAAAALATTFALSAALVAAEPAAAPASTQVQAEVPATGATYTATVVGHDASRDVALLRLQDAAGPAPSPPTA